MTLQPDAHGCPASMAVSSGSGAAVATTPEGGSPTAPSSSEDVNPSPPRLRSTSYLQMAHPNEMLGAPWDRPAKSPGNRRDVRCVRSKRSVGACPARGSDSNPQISQSVSRRSSARAREISTGAAEGANPFIKERRDRSEIMLIRPQQTHESSTNAASACRRPRH